MEIIVVLLPETATSAGAVLLLSDLVGAIFSGRFTSEKLDASCAKALFAPVKISVKIRNEKNEDLDYPYTNNVNYDDFENYIKWFSLYK